MVKYDFKWSILGLNEQVTNREPKELILLKFKWIFFSDSTYATLFYSVNRFVFVIVADLP